MNPQENPPGQPPQPIQICRDRLEGIAESLIWISETEAPLAWVSWPGISGVELTEAQILAAADLPIGTPVVAVTLENFLAPAIQTKVWQGNAAQQTAQQFQKLSSVLTQCLSQPRVYRCGDIEIEIYILGQALEGNWVGLHTHAVET